MDAPATMLGRLKTRDELDKYETFWHENVFVPARQELEEKVRDRLINVLKRITITCDILGVTLRGI